MPAFFSPSSILFSSSFSLLLPPVVFPLSVVAPSPPASRWCHNFVRSSPRSTLFAPLDNYAWSTFLSTYRLTFSLRSFTRIVWPVLKDLEASSTSRPRFHPRPQHEQSGFGASTVDDELINGIHAADSLRSPAHVHDPESRIR